MTTLKIFLKNEKSLNSKANKELDRIIAQIQSKDSYQEQIDYLKGKTFIDSFHR